MAAAEPTPPQTGTPRSPQAPCAPVIERRTLTMSPPLLRPSVDANPITSGSTAAADAAQPLDYRRLLATTQHGWPRLDHWCVWIEPPGGAPSAGIWELRWQAAVDGALASWRQVLPIQLVGDPAFAQVRVRRRRPPLAPDASGRMRASHGRATLTLEAVRRDGDIRLEPVVDVLLSPAQRQSAIQATALHELGHAFGLWGHSDHNSDAMAAIPGAEPVLQLSARDLATLRWLYSQPTRFGQSITP
jgi:predicted Zn-dependent protease